MNKKRKTEKVFRGIDHTEIQEWLGVDSYEKKSKLCIIILKLKIFFHEVKWIYKRLFGKYRLFDGEIVNDHKTKEKISDLSSKLFGSQTPTKEDQEKIDGIRTYTKRLSEWENTYLSPLWKGLYQIESDEEFLRFVEELYEHMWD